MLSPRYLAGISDDIVRIYAQLEHDIVIDMARRLHKMGAVSDASVWQAGIFKEIGGLQADVQKYLAKYDKQAQKEITALFEEALRKSDKADMRVFDAAKRNMSDRQRLIFEAIAEKQQSAGIVTGSKAAQEGIIKTFSNLSRLTMSIAATSSADFITQANAAFMQTVTGAFDYKTALKNAVKNLAQKGIHTVEYTDSGKRILRSIEGAVRSNILTGINQTASRRTLDNCQDLDCDLVEVSAHMGARPSHAAWQGKVYSLSGTSDKYPSFYQECRPGGPDGIGGVNCRHSYYPYFEGMPRMYSDGELDEMKEPTVGYNGKKITQYEAEQNLRALERGIRTHKLEVDALEAAGLDATAEKQRLGAWQAKAREYCKETGIRRDYSREYVGTASGKQPKGLKPKDTHEKAIVIKETRVPVSKTENKIPDYKDVDTIGKARMYAENILQLDYVEYDKIDLSVANVINKELTDIKNTFNILKLDSIRVYPKKTDAYAMYLPQAKIIYVKNVASKGALGKLTKDADKMFKMGFWSTNGASHFIRHEAGHHIFHELTDNNPRLKNKINVIFQRKREEVLQNKHWSDKDLEGMRRAKEKGVSFYGMRNLDEFAAECIAEYQKGKMRKTAKEICALLIKGDI